MVSNTNIHLVLPIPRDKIAFGTPNQQKPIKDVPSSKGKKSKKGKANKPLVYYTSAVEHVHGADTRSIMLTLPECTIRGGVTFKDNEDSDDSDNDDEQKEKKRKPQIMCVFDCPRNEYMTDADHEKLTDDVRQLMDDITWLKEQALDYRWANMERFGIDKELIASKDIMRPQIAKWLHKKSTDRNAAMWLNLRNFADNRTPFFDLAGTVVDWDLLMNVNFTAIPTIRIRHLFSNTQYTSFICDVVSVQMTGPVVAASVYNPSADVAEKIRNQCRDLVERQKEALALRDLKRQKTMALRDEDGQVDDDDIMN